MEGLEIKNDAGSFQINQNTRVTAFLRKGNAVFNTSFEEFDTTYVKVACNPLTEVLAYRCDNTVSVLYSVDGYTYIGGSSSAEGSTLEFWIFGKSTSISNSGVQVFDGSGTSVSNLLYDSSWIPIKPLGIYGSELASTPYGTPQNYSYNIGSGSFAVIPLSVFCTIDKEVSRTAGTTDEVDVFYYRTDNGSKISGSTLTIERATVEQFVKFYVGVRWSSSYAYNYYKSNDAKTQYMLIDVAGL